MNRRVASITAICVLAVFATVCGLDKLPPVFAQNEAAKTELKIPLNQKVSTPCSEKEIEISGVIQAQVRVRPDIESSGSIVEADFNYGEIAGVGSASGSKYLANGTSHFDSSGSSKQEFNIVGNFALNKVKSFDNVMAHVKLRISVDLKRKVAITVREVTIDCGT